LRDLNRAIELDGNLADAYVDRGSEYLRRGEFDKAFTEFGTAVGKHQSRAVDVLAAVERRAAELAKIDGVEPERVCAVCRRALEMVKTALNDRPDVGKAVDAALAAAAKEGELAKQANLLRGAVADMREKLGPWMEKR
jgi:hypothetical protein